MVIIGRLGRLLWYAVYYYPARDRLDRYGGQLLKVHDTNHYEDHQYQ